MRLLVLTANPAFESSRWWSIVGKTSGISDVLIVCERRPRRAWQSLRRNIRRHGIIWIPYRIFHLGRELFSRTPDEEPLPPELTIRVERENVVSLHDPDTLNRVRQWGPDVGLSIGAPILRTELFTIPQRGTVNLHLGKTPDYRGAPPGFWELWTDATEIGATIHWIDEGLDTGPVVAQATAPVYTNDTLTRTTERAEALGEIVLAQALADLAGSRYPAQPQAGPGRTYRIPTVFQRMRLHTRTAARRMARRFRPRYLIKSTVSFALLVVVRPVRDFVRGLRRTHPVRVFTYHRVTTLCRDGMTIPPSEFRRQMTYLARTHDVVSLEVALHALESGTPLRRPMAVITFDDGYRSVYTDGWPAMRALNLPGFVFLATSLVGTSRRYPHDALNPVRDHLSVMSWDEIRTLQAAGWGVGAHSTTHARLSELEDDEARTEMTTSMTALSENLGISHPVMAYPFGAKTDMTETQFAVAKEVGYRSVCSNYGGENFHGVPRSTVERIDLGGDHDRLAWKTYARGFDLAAMGRLFGLRA